MAPAQRPRVAGATLFPVVCELELSSCQLSSLAVAALRSCAAHPAPRPLLRSAARLIAISSAGMHKPSQRAAAHDSASRASPLGLPSPAHPDSQRARSSQPGWTATTAHGQPSAPAALIGTATPPVAAIRGWRTAPGPRMSVCAPVEHPPWPPDPVCLCVCLNQYRDCHRRTKWHG